MANLDGEILHPGVFVEELPGGVHPIDGVDTTSPTTTRRRMAAVLVLVGGTALAGWWWRRRRGT